MKNLEKISKVSLYLYHTKPVTVSNGQIKISIADSQSKGIGFTVSIPENFVQFFTNPQKVYTMKHILDNILYVPFVLGNLGKRMHASYRIFDKVESKFFSEQTKTF